MWKLLVTVKEKYFIEVTESHVRIYNNLFHQKKLGRFTVILLLLICTSFKFQSPLYLRHNVYRYNYILLFSCFKIIFMELILTIERFVWVLSLI